MPDIGKATVSVTAETANIEMTLRILAKHAVACADELAFARGVHVGGCNDGCGAMGHLLLGDER